MGPVMAKGIQTKKKKRVEAKSYSMGMETNPAHRWVERGRKGGLKAQRNPQNIVQAYTNPACVTTCRLVGGMYRLRTLEKRSMRWIWKAIMAFNHMLAVKETLR